MYIEQKQCNKCKQYLELTAFGKFYKKEKMYYRGICNVCRCIEYKDSRNNNSALDNWIKMCLSNTKKRAKLKGLDHNLTSEWLLNNMPETCPILGIILSFTGNKNNKL